MRCRLPIELSLMAFTLNLEIPCYETVAANFGPNIENQRRSLEDRHLLAVGGDNTVPVRQRSRAL